MVETTIHVEHTTATQTTTTGGGLSAIRINLDYFRTLPGILKLLQIFFGILCMALGSPAFLGFMNFFMFVVVAAFIITVLWTFAYLLGIREALTLGINWILSELVNTAIVAFLYILAALIQLLSVGDYRGLSGKYLAAGIVAIFNCIAYGTGSFLLYIAFRNGQVL